MKAGTDTGEWYHGVPLSAKGTILTGLAILVVWLGCFGVWAGVAPLNSAVVAAGTFVATGQNKLVQHFEGGIIREIAVKEGDVVEANEVLVRMDDTAANSRLRRLVLKKYRLLAMKTRLEAEMGASGTIETPAAFSRSRRDPEIEAILERQRIELRARQDSRATEEAVLRTEIAGLQESIRGYQAQVQSTKDRIALFAEELKDKNMLLDHPGRRESVPRRRPAPSRSRCSNFVNPPRFSPEARLGASQRQHIRLADQLLRTIWS
jgi:HlyD family secretion protein